MQTRDSPGPFARTSGRQLSLCLTHRCITCNIRSKVSVEEPGLRMTTFTIAETCKHLGISRATAMRWLRSGKLAAAMIGGAWRIPSSEIEKRLTYRIVRHAAEPL